MRFSAALSTELHGQAVGHLLRQDGQEDLCFALWYPSQGSDRTSALLHELILPTEGERLLHGNASFLPAYFERALGAAVAAKAGLALLHSHVGPGWQGMSSDDVVAELGHAAPAKGATGLPLVGLTLGTDEAWSARFWEKTASRSYERRWCETVRVVGDRLVVTYAEKMQPELLFRPELARTISAWGPRIQEVLARLRIGVIGAGSVGSIVAEALARMGVSRVRLIDFDSVEPVNLDRLLHATRRDVALGRSKVAVLARALAESATARQFMVEPLEWSVVEEEGYRAALDCDVLFSCVDRPWPRSVLNFIAYAHLIPVVDGGVLVTLKADGKTMRHADMRAHVAAPGRRCLECLGQYDPGDVSAERGGHLDDPSYIAGLPRDQSHRANENVFAFGLNAASLEILQFLTMVVAPCGVANPGAQIYHFPTGTLDRNEEEACNPGCVYPKLTALGDCTGMIVTGRHEKAEQARQVRVAHRRRWCCSLLNWSQQLRKTTRAVLSYLAERT